MIPLLFLSFRARIVNNSLLHLAGKSAASPWTTRAKAPRGRPWICPLHCLEGEPSPASPVAQVTGAADSVCAPAQALQGKEGTQASLQRCHLRGQLGEGSHGEAPASFQCWLQGCYGWRREGGELGSRSLISDCALTSQLVLPLQEKPQRSLTSQQAKPVGLLT